MTDLLPCRGWSLMMCFCLTFLRIVLPTQNGGFYITYLEEMVPQGATEVRVELSIMEVSVVVTVDLMAGAQLRQGDCKNSCMHGLHSAAQVDMEAEADLRPLRFDPLRHGMLCEELKHLYTAITRAKNNVIIFDSNPKKRAPFFQYLQRLNLARVVRR